MTKNELKTVLITGASAGIGAALALCFARKGHDLILVARSADKLQALADELSQEYSVQAVVIALDLAQADAAQQLVQRLDEQALQVDILVNNAGLLYEGPYWETPLAKHQQLLQLNIGTLSALCHLLLPGMIARGGGRILNLSSTSAFQPVPYLSTYAASKAFVLSFSEALNIELKNTGVKVTALCPGFTETDMIAKDDGQSMSIPLVRNMSAQEVAQQGYVACMAGKPSFINGTGNRALITFGRYQPRWLQRLIIAAVAKKGIASAPSSAVGG